MSDIDETVGSEPAATVTPITVPAKRSRSRATRAAEKNAAGNGSAKSPPAQKPAPAKPEPTELTHNAKRLVVMNAMIAAGADVILHWDAKKTGVPKDEARAIMANRLSYAGPKTEWPEKILGARP